MSVGSFIGRLASLTGIQPSHEQVDMTVNDPFLGVSSGWARWVGLGHAAKWGVEDMLELRRALFWIAAVVVFLLIAAITNPTESSFRSHLTELSFRRHLADIRTSDDRSTDDESTSAPATPAEIPISHHIGTGSGHETPPIAPFRFANHVAISLRTPPLHYRTFFFFSFSLTSPLSPPLYLSDPTPLSKKHTALPPRERLVLFVGYFGHWVWLGHIPRKVEWVWRFFTEGTREKGKKRNAAMDRPGIMELRAVASKDDSSNGPKAITALPPSLTVNKHVRKSDSVTNLADHGTLPLHAHPAPIPVAPFVPESRRSSIVNLVSAQPLSSTTVIESPEAASSPVIIALKTDLTAAQAVLSEIKSQLHSHEESVSSAHSHLQSTLDELRNRRKEDDAERQELKSRTKSLEEQKRQAEAARRDAEKKLRAVETVRDGLEAKIAAALGEIEEMKGLMESSVKSVRTVQEEGAKFIVGSCETLQGKNAELEGLEGEIVELDSRNEELGRLIQEAEEKVAEAVKAGDEAKRLGPEEEMMMMAAAYEAAAQEGYQHGSTPTNQHGYPTRGENNNRNSAGGDQWAHQAAAYMAEAGMPYLDQNYTARPGHATSFAHLAKSHKPVDEKRPADLIGFEDFGPGAQANLKRTITPPASDSGSDVWGHDPGSPNGGISTSFSANLLPQELFRSLAGDTTPLDATTEADEDDDFPPTTLQEALAIPPVSGEGGPDDNRSSESGSSESHSAGHEADIEIEHDDHSDHNNHSNNDQAGWRSPAPVHAVLHPYSLGVSHSENRLLPPSSTPPGGPGGGPALPGLPALPGSRRWVSGTASSENLNNIFGASPSNDSLLLGHYEASPFAPSAVEKQQLALKWGPFHKRWAARESANSNNSTSPASVHGPGNLPNMGRSISANFESSSTWLSSRFTSKRDAASDHQDHDHDHGNGLPSSPLGRGPAPTINVNGNGNGNASGVEDNEKLGTSAGSGNSLGEKKPFRFFSLRRPTSSGQGSSSDRTGTSPARE